MTEVYVSPLEWAPTSYGTAEADDRLEEYISQHPGTGFKNIMLDFPERVDPVLHPWFRIQSLCLQRRIKITRPAEDSEWEIRISEKDEVPA